MAAVVTDRRRKIGRRRWHRGKAGPGSVLKARGGWMTGAGVVAGRNDPDPLSHALDGHRGRAGGRCYSHGPALRNLHVKKLQ